ncbi:MAG: Tfp pilus assembly protein FimT/FimU [Acidobacteriota bacterium]
MAIKRLSDSCGFTLFELVIVLLVLGISVAVIVPRMGAGRARMEDKEFLREFSETLRRARLRATNSGEVVIFRIRGSERTFGIEDPPGKAIPENTDLYAAHLETDPETMDNIMLFYPDGSVTGSDMDVTFDGHRTYRVFIHPLFGTVRLSKMEIR